MTSKLDRTEADVLLRDAGVGTLALTDGAEAYSIPESFGYDGETLYFQFVYTEESKKMAFIETTDRATLTVCTDDPARSVLVQGSVEPVPEDDEIEAAAAIAENATIPTLNVYPETAPGEISMDYYRLRPTEVSGRRFQDGTSIPAES